MGIVTGVYETLTLVMPNALPDKLRVDRGSLRITSFAEADQEDRAFWFSKTPLERLQHVETLRELNYGSAVIDQGLQRVLTVVKRPRR